MNKVTVVSAFVPLRNGRESVSKHLTRSDYLDYADRLKKAVKAAGCQFSFFWDFPFHKCWLAQTNFPLKASNPRAEDRFANDLDHVLCNVVQHSRTQWAMMELESHPDNDIIVWLDCAILKQGKWNNNPVTEEHVTAFLKKIQSWNKVDCIPFPGITKTIQHIEPRGNNWRFCGSTHIWPTKYLKQIDELYREECENFIDTYKSVPLDLAIWPLVEQRNELPFCWYQGEYDATQLTNLQTVGYGPRPYPWEKYGDAWKVERDVLVRLASEVDGDILEIGTYLGETAAYLARHLPDKLVWTIDGVNPATFSPEQRSECLPKEQVGIRCKELFNVRQIMGSSHTVDLPGSVGLIFIDGDHSEAGVRADTELAIKYFKNRTGTIVWHDYVEGDSWVKVKKVVDSLGLKIETYSGTMLASTKIVPAKEPRILVAATTHHTQPYVSRRRLCEETWVPELEKLGVDFVWQQSTDRITRPKRNGRELWLPGNDSHKALTIRAQWVCRWAYEQGYDRLCFSSDDVYTLPDRLAKHLKESKASYVGYILADDRGRPVEFCSGAAFHLDRKAMKVFADAVLPESPRQYDWGDKEIGTQLHRQGIFPLHDERFSDWGRVAMKPGNDNDLITCHQLPPELWKRRPNELELTEMAKRSQTPKVCLNMIVKDEEKIIHRCLRSVREHIHAYVILDTGSTDKTIDIIKTELKGLPGKVVEGKWKNFRDSRNEALEYCKASEYDFDTILLLDADMELRVKGPLPTQFRALALPQLNALEYCNVRLIRRNERSQYFCVTHEYLGVEGVQRFDNWYFIDHADGASRPEKLIRDEALLRQGIKEEPNNPRYFYYLARTLQDANKLGEAISHYKRRIQIGGWDEEVWHSFYQIAKCWKDLGQEELEPQFIKACWDAYEFRPTRTEPLVLLNTYYRAKGKNELVLAIDKIIESLPKPNDSLFIERFAYGPSVSWDRSICGFYSKIPEERARGRQECLKLTTAPDTDIQAALNNWVYYAKDAKELFGADVGELVLPFKLEEGWLAMNPSMCIQNGKSQTLVRTVNYFINGQGQYITPDGIVRTRNFLNGREVRDLTQTPKWETRIRGYEDMRIFHWRNSLWATATACDLDDKETRQLVRLRINNEGDIVDVVPNRTMEPMRAQKNWVPIISDQDHHLFLVYQTGPTLIIRWDGADPVPVSVNTPSVCLDQLRGGSQAIKFWNGYIYLTHEVAWSSGSRNYLHRFVYLEYNKVHSITEPFRFQHKGIEFCAGLVEVNNRLIASFAVNDAQPCLARFDPEEVKARLIRVSE